MVLWTKMIPMVSFLAALRMLIKAQTCNNGHGQLVYEMVANYKLSGNNGFGFARNEMITKRDVPVKVLEECIRRCQEDRTTSIQQCLSFDFMPSRRRSGLFVDPKSGSVPEGYMYPEETTSVEGNSGENRGVGKALARERFSKTVLSTGLHNRNAPSGDTTRLYGDSTCYLHYDRASPDGSDRLVREADAWHFNEMCLSSPKIRRECSNRLYIFERTPGYRFEDDGEEMFVINRTECQDKCLNEDRFPCRSVTFDRAKQLCKLSKQTKQMNPRAFQEDANSDYMENLCLPESKICSNKAFIMDAGKELDGAYDRDLVSVSDYGKCSALCSKSLEERGFYCRSFVFDDNSNTCLLYDEDPVGYKESPEANDALKSSSGNYFRVLCGSQERDSLFNNATLERFQRKKLDGSHDTEINSYSFQECLDECMRRYGRDCRSVEFSSRYHSCRFSSYEGGWGTARPNLIDDDYYDYYEFRWLRGDGRYGGGSTPERTDYGGFNGGRWGGGWGDSKAGIGRHPRPPLPPPPLPPHWESYGGRPEGNYGGRYGGSYGASDGYNRLPPGPPPPPPLPPGPNSIYPPRLPGPPIPPGPGGLGYPTCTDHGRGGAPGGNLFQRVGFGQRLRSFYVRKVVRADRLEDCERACIEARDFECRSFNFRSLFPENCELSDIDTTQVQLSNPSHFDDNTQFDFYERDGPGPGRHCLDVSQSCSPDGMEFSLRTPGGFYGRIYTYGFYDTCFYDGNGGNINVLRISRANGFPRCGTQQYGDVMTNIVVVQFNDYVQTSRDKVYNLTCYLSGVGETVVTSNYLDSRTDGRYPTQIEHLPAQNILTSSVVLRILYRGTPTNTIAVGDLLTFRLEARGQYRYDFFTGDIFATNVIAKDPYSGREVQLIDSRGCPIDLYVFPELHRTPDGALEADFYAFKIPDSNLLVFQATVRTCRGPCEPIICSDPGRPGTFPSWGRRKRSVSNSTELSGPAAPSIHAGQSSLIDTPSNGTNDEEKEEVHELLNVYLSRSDIPSEGPTAVYEAPTVCVAQAGYYTLIVVVSVLLCLLIAVAAAATYQVRKAKLALKQADADSTSPSTANLYVSQFQAPRFEDPSEPIYTDPSLFERSRSFSSMTVPNLDNMKPKTDENS
ncbi:uncharacterized protein LOC143237278 [Tachypleus tridentatus]|uniref:uncharacterized protein LOC143237278 n=1 Tax=Tachypleus tridentatus TaxID=6853 RepID=UPI003FD5939A